jgi:protein SCO1/2
MRRLLALLLMLVATPAHAFDPFAKAGVDHVADAQVPLDVVFRDQRQREVSLRAAGRGLPIVLAPVLHRCPNICGLTLGGLAQAVLLQKYRPGRDFALVTLGIDPREGPAEAEASIDDLHRSFPGLDLGDMHALTGKAADIARVTGALGYRFGWDESIGQYAHIAAVAILAPDGRLSRWLYGITPQPADLELALTEAGQGRLGSWRDQLLLLCYHYDPRTGRYGPVIWSVLRVAGGFTVVASGLFIGWALVRERRAARRGAR